MQPDAQENAPRPASRGVGGTNDQGLQAYRSTTAVQTSTPPNIDLLLSRLERVRKAGAGWSARCPAHEDRTASLSVSTGNDGRLLVHCFAGCPIGDVLGAIGLSVGDLFPRRLNDSPEQRAESRRFAIMADWSAALGVLEREAGVLLIACGDLARGISLSDADAARLALAEERLKDARRVLMRGRHG